jgi:hypothetical protein
MAKATSDNRDSELKGDDSWRALHSLGHQAGCRPTGNSDDHESQVRFGFPLPRRGGALTGALDNQMIDR